MSGRWNKRVGRLGEEKGVKAVVKWDEKGL